MKKIHVWFLVGFLVMLCCLKAGAQAIKQTRGGGTVSGGGGGGSFTQYITTSTPLLVIGNCPANTTDLLGVLYYVTPSSGGLAGVYVYSDATGLSDFAGNQLVVGLTTTTYFARLHYCTPL